MARVRAEQFGPSRAYDGDPEDGDVMRCPDCGGETILERGWKNQTRERWCENPVCDWEDYIEADFEGMLNR